MLAVAAAAAVGVGTAASVSIAVAGSLAATLAYEPDPGEGLVWLAGGLAEQCGTRQLKGIGAVTLLALGEADWGPWAWNGP